MVTTRAALRPRTADDEFRRRFEESFDDIGTDTDPALLDEVSNEPLDDIPAEPFDDDGVPDAALFLPFRDGRPGWR